MTVRSGRLDLKLSAHLISPHCCERVCWDMPYPNVLTYMLSTFSPPVPATSFNTVGNDFNSTIFPHSDTRSRDIVINIYPRTGTDAHF